MKFKFLMSDRQINDLNLYLACEKVKEIMGSDFMYNAILKRNSFDYCDETPLEIAKHIKYAAGCDTLFINIKTYRPWWYFSKALGMTVGNTISLNSRRFPMKFEFLVSLLLHECCHVISYSHGNNSPTGKENSVPYYANAVVEDWFKQE